MKPDLPFSERFKEPILAGRKVATSRSKRYGWAGDRLTIPWGRAVVLESVVQVKLGHAGAVMWREEGVASPAEFEAVWREIHPRAGFDPEKLVWLHLFHLETCGLCGVDLEHAHAPDGRFVGPMELRALEARR